MLAAVSCTNQIEILEQNQVIKVHQWVTSLPSDRSASTHQGGLVVPRLADEGKGLIPDEGKV